MCVWRVLEENDRERVGLLIFLFHKVNDGDCGDDRELSCQLPGKGQAEVLHGEGLCKVLTNCFKREVPLRQAPAEYRALCQVLAVLWQVKWGPDSLKEL